jgi:CRISPR-associated protein Cas1
MVNEFVYCPRLFYIEWVQGEFRHSVDTVEGAAVHRRVDRESGAFEVAEAVQPDEEWQARSVLLSAPRLGLIARVDIVEGRGGKVRPVDYKKGRPGKEGPRDPERVQMAVQALVLRENGYDCEEGVIYYAESKQRVTVPLDSSVLERTLAIVEDLRRVASAAVPPPPLVNSPKCPRCSLVGICLPDETAFLRGERMEEVRRLVPARDDATPVYVAEQGAVVGVSGERLTIRRREGEPVSVRLLDVSQVSLYGNVQVTAQALRALAERGVPIFHHTYGGWLAAVTSGVLSHNAQLRCEQYRVADDAQGALNIARAMVAGKLQNQRTLLRRNHPSCPPAALRELARLTKAARQASDVDRLFGIEGLGAGLLRAFRGHAEGSHGVRRGRARSSAGPGPGERDAVLPVRPPAEGRGAGRAGGGAGPVPGAVPPDAARAAVAGLGPDGGVPADRGGLCGVVACEQPGGGAGGLCPTWAGVRTERRSPAAGD